MFRYFTDFVTVMCSETGQILPQNLVVRPKRPTNPSKEKLSYQRCFHFEVRLAHFTGKPRIRGQSDQIFNQELVYVFICKDFIHFGGGDLGDNNSRVSEMKFTCSYDRYRPTYICWWRLLGTHGTQDYAHPATTTSVYGPIPIIEAGKNYLENTPNNVISLISTQHSFHES